MATVLQPIANELNIALMHLHTELRGLQTDADGAGIASVMAPAVSAGKQSPADLQNKIKADALLGSVTVEQNDTSAARRNVRRLMEDYLTTPSRWLRPLLRSHDHHHSLRRLTFTQSNRERKR